MAVDVNMVSDFLQDRYDQLIAQHDRLGKNLTSAMVEEYFYNLMPTLPTEYVDVIASVNEPYYRRWIVDLAERCIIERELLGEPR